MAQELEFYAFARELISELTGSAADSLQGCLQASADKVRTAAATSANPAIAMLECIVGDLYRMPDTILDPTPRWVYAVQMGKHLHETIMRVYANYTVQLLKMPRDFPYPTQFKEFYQIAQSVLWHTIEHVGGSTQVLISIFEHVPREQWDILVEKTSVNICDFVLTHRNNLLTMRSPVERTFPAATTIEGAIHSVH
jgi:hypothetical protein